VNGMLMRLERRGYRGEMHASVSVWIEIGADEGAVCVVY
jgi:hypothetical protein